MMQKNFLILSSIIISFLFLGCSVVAQIQSGVDLYKYQSVAVANNDFVCEFPSNADVTIKIQKNDTFGLLSMQNRELVTDGFPGFHDTINTNSNISGIIVSKREFTLLLYPDGNIALEHLVQCPDYTAKCFVKENPGKCTKLEGSHFTIKSRVN